MFQSGNAFPSTVWVDHNMVVYDKMNNAGSWSVGSRIDAMFEACEEAGLCGNADADGDGFLSDNDNCPNDYNPGQEDSDLDGIGDLCDDCHNSLGDINEDMIIDILDIVNVVNIVLSGGVNSSNYTECQLLNANFNQDGLINVLDIIQIINTILGQGLNSIHVDVNSPAYVSLNSVDDNLILNISSSTDFTGIEITFNTNTLLPVSIDNNRSDIQVSTDLYNNTQKILIFSLENLPFDGNSINISINGSLTLGPEDFDIIVASRFGESVAVAHTAVEVDSFTMKGLYPNPFNPVTKLSYDVEKAGNLRITVFNILGQEVAELYNDYQSFGSHSIIWNASNMASGVYYMSLELNGQSETNKVMLIK